MSRHGFFRVSPIDEDRRSVDRATVRRVIGTFKPYKGKVGLVGLMIGITSGLGVINPLMIVLVFDKALFGANGTCNGPDLPHERRRPERDAGSPEPVVPAPPGDAAAFLHDDADR
jgi:hypothetical protein